MTNLSPAERRLLRIIEQNIILSSRGVEGDVIDPSTGKTVVPDETAERLIESGLAAWEWTEDYQEFRLVLTEAGLGESRKPDA